MKIMKKRRKLFPVIGKYIDTPTKAELDVVFFIDDVGDYKLSNATLPSTTLKSCRFQLKSSQLKLKKKFGKQLQQFLDDSTAKEYGYGKPKQMPLLFGLLKLRKGKVRKLVLIASAGALFNSKVINVFAVNLDNLLYMDLVNKLKNNP